MEKSYLDLITTMIISDSSLMIFLAMMIRNGDQPVLKNINEMLKFSEFHFILTMVMEGTKSQRRSWFPLRQRLWL